MALWSPPLLPIFFLWVSVNEHMKVCVFIQYVSISQYVSLMMADWHMRWGIVLIGCFSYHMVVLAVLNSKNTMAPPFQLLVIQSRLSFFFETLDTHPYLRLHERFEQIQTDFLRSASFIFSPLHRFWNPGMFQFQSKNLDKIINLGTSSKISIKSSI